jgi:hypothetical protein
MGTSYIQAHNRTLGMLALAWRLPLALTTNYRTWWPYEKITTKAKRIKENIRQQGAASFLSPSYP